MKKYIYFDDALKMAMSELGGYPERPQEIVKYHTYKNGTVKTFDTKEEALNFSSNIERIVINKDEISQYIQTVSKITSKANEISYQSMREEFSYLNDEQFNKIYNKAYDRKHAYGIDEVYEEMCYLLE